MSCASVPSCCTFCLFFVRQRCFYFVSSVVLFSAPSLFSLAVCQARTFLGVFFGNYFKAVLPFPWPGVLASALPSPAPHATAHRLMEKCFEHNAYACVHRRAPAASKLNMQIILFSLSVSNRVYLPKNPIIADNYYPVSPVEFSTLTDRSSVRGNSSPVSQTHTQTCINIVAASQPKGILKALSRFFRCSDFCTFKHFHSSLGWGRFFIFFANFFFCLHWIQISVCFASVLDVARSSEACKCVRSSSKTEHFFR